MDKDILYKLKENTIFKDLEISDLEHLLSISIIKNFYKNNIIFYQGDMPLYLHILIEGKIKIYKNNSKGDEVILKFINETELIAQLANIEEIPFPSNCMAIKNSKVLLVNYTKFKSQFLKDPKFLFIFVKSLIKKVLELEDILSTHLTLDTKAKVAKFIYENEKTFNNKTNIEISKILNIAPETLSRTIKKFKDEGVIENKRCSLKIINFEKLKEYFNKDNYY